MVYASRKTFEKHVSAHIQHFYIVRACLLMEAILGIIICSHFDVLFLKKLLFYKIHNYIDNYKETRSNCCKSF